MTDAMASAALGDAQPKAKIFISYSRKDLAFVDKVDAALRARGFESLIDRSEIYAFEDWWTRIETLITKADTVVFVLSPDAVASEVTLKEVAFAASLNKRFAPVVCRRVDDREVPGELRRLNFIFCDDAARFEESMERLAEALETDIDWVRKHTEFGEQTRRWVAAGQPGPRGLLLRSPILEEAERWIASRPANAPPPTREMLEFVTESRKAATAEMHRARRIRVIVGILALGVVAGLSYSGWSNQAYLKLRAVMLDQVLQRKVLSLLDERALKQKDTFKECTRCPEMVVVPAGEFMMGSPPNEKGRWDNEGPQHKITIAKPFAVSKFEVTFDEWDACVALGGCSSKLPSDEFWGRGRRPVINVSWDDAQQYVEWLSKQTGKPYRLLSEAEWEYAARAGSNTAYSWGEEIGNGNANCPRCSSDWGYHMKTALVGSFPANAFGLHDMHGNIDEWVQDCYQDNYNGAPSDGSALTNGMCADRVVRGGSWFHLGEDSRSASRTKSSPTIRWLHLGFRVARTLSQ